MLGAVASVELDERGHEELRIVPRRTQDANGARIGLVLVLARYVGHGKRREQISAERGSQDPLGSTSLTECGGECGIREEPGAYMRVSVSELGVSHLMGEHRCDETDVVVEFLEQARKYDHLHVGHAPGVDDAVVVHHFELPILESAKRGVGGHESSDDTVEFRAEGFVGGEDLVGLQEDIVLRLGELVYETVRYESGKSGLRNGGTGVDVIAYAVAPGIRSRIGPGCGRGRLGGRSGNGSRGGRVCASAPRPEARTTATDFYDTIFRRHLYGAVERTLDPCGDIRPERGRLARGGGGGSERADDGE